MITIKGFPLLHEDECKDLFSADSSWGSYYFFKPKYTWLPDMKELEDDEKEKYLYKNVKEGMYLTGLEIISGKWVNKGFCGWVLCNLGLVIDEAYPVIRKDDFNGSMLHISFDHISEAVHGMDIELETTS